jgi:tetratricopeptide (TPR) repeat protein
MAHFALSNLFGAEGDDAKAEWHLEQAHRLDNEFVAVINNLAWLLAHKREPDLDRALELAEIAVSRVPGNAEFLDTLGSVLLLQNRHEQAIAIFEKALRNSRSKNEIHVKLAACYRAIGRTDLANLHARNAKKPAEN